MYANSFYHSTQRTGNHSHSVLTRGKLVLLPYTLPGIKYLFIILCLITFSGFAQNTATLYGKVVNKENNPVDFVTISILGSSQNPANTNKNGEYEYIVPAGKEVVVVFSLTGYEQLRIPITLSPGERKQMDASLKFSTKVSSDTITIIGERRNVPMTSIDPINYFRVPTANPDINVLLFSQPGVISRNELSSQYSVRGGNFDENLVYVNDIEVYRPFLIRSGQQEGLSFANPDMVSSILFSAGGFEAKYGDKMSSVLDIRYRKPRKFAGTVSGGMLGGSLHLEGCSDNFRFTWLTGARYKSSKYILGSLDTKGDYKPAFTDVQSYMTYDITEKWELGFLFNYSKNKFNLVPQSQQTTFGTLSKALQLDIYFDGQEVDQFETFTGAVSSSFIPNDNTNLKFIASTFSSSEDETYDILGQYYIDELETDIGKPNFGQAVLNRGVGSFLNHARNYLDANVYNAEHKGSYRMGNNQLLWGAKYQVEMIQDKLSEWKYIDSAGFSLPQYPPGSIDVQELIKAKINLNSSRYSGFTQFSRNFELKDTSTLTLTAGVRSSYWDENNQVTISPRATLAFQPFWKMDFVFRASAGYYHQPPFYRELRDIEGVIHTNVKAQQSIHFLLGSDYEFEAWSRPFKFVAEMYYKKLDNLVPYEIDNVRIRYYGKNNSKGYATGIDMKINGEFVKGAESWASLSIMQTKEDILDDFYFIRLNSDGDTIIPGYTINTKAVDSIRKEPGFIPRPGDQRLTFSIFFQDYVPKIPDLKVHLHLLFGSSVPFGPPGYERYKDTLKSTFYRRVDIGFSYQVLKEGKKISEKHFLKHLKSIWVSLEVFNLLQVKNTISYTWIKDVTGRQYAIPNYLTARQLNLRVIIKI